MSFKTLIILGLIGLFATLVLAETKDQYDACDGLAIFFVWNDTSYWAPDSTGPFGDTTMTGCPVDLYLNTPDDTVEQMYYPDTLVWADSILAYEACSTYFLTESFYNPVPLGGDSVMSHPAYDPTCRKAGIYAKARMFDNLTGTYSPWVDINTTDMFLVNYIGGDWGLVLQISLNNFKVRNLSSLMGFDCNVDTLILYVWDADDGDLAGTAGNLGVVKRIFTDGDDLSAENRIYLRKYVDCTGGDISEDNPEMPKAFSLGQNQPNPFNSATQISYALPEDANVSIEITNILGQKVRTLVNSRETAGYKSVVWNGLDDSSKEAPSGVYFYTIRANDFTAKKRAILMK